MDTLIQEFMKEYKRNSNELVDSNERYYKLLDLLTNYIQQQLSDKYLVKGSCGQGRKSECPWICIFDKHITTGARNGIYYAILFKSDMTGFYLSLCLGMEKFKEKFKIKWEENLKEVAEYFRKKINSETFKLPNINLNVDKNTRGYGYEASNIIAKYYELGKNADELDRDIIQMTKIYGEICGAISSTTYSEVIDNILSYSSASLISIDEANYQIEQAILKESNLQETEIVQLTEIDFPSTKTNKRFFEMSTKKIMKRNYLDSTKKQAKVGLIGELLVMEYERQKMLLHKREDLVNKIYWVSEIDDSKGYDIESFDFDENGNEYKIYIEVKTTENDSKNIFFISANEIEKMQQLYDKYWIYRVFKLNKNPVFFKINGKDFENKIILKNHTYVAEIK